MHGLDPDTWKKVDVVYIDIGDRSQVESKVSVSLRLLEAFSYLFHYSLEYTGQDSNTTMCGNEGICEVISYGYGLST